MKQMAALLASVLLLFQGCMSMTGVRGRQEERDVTPGILYNGYLGLTVTVPEDWVIYSWNADNMTPDREDSGAYADLDRELYLDGGSFIDLLCLESTVDTDSREHVYMNFFAEEYLDAYPSLEDYVELCRWAYAGTDGDYEVEFLREEETRLGFDSYTCLTFFTLDTTNSSTYYEEYYIRMIGDLFFTAYITYREDNLQVEDIRRVLGGAFSVDANSPAEREAVGPSGAVGVYYNGYLDLTVTIPGDCHTTINHNNLTAAPDLSQRLDQMEVEEYPDGGYGIDFVSISTEMLTEQVGYAQLDLYAEGYPKLTWEEYLELFAWSVSDPYGDGEELPVQQSPVELNGVLFECFTVTYELFGDVGVPMTVEYYITERRGLFFIACAVYWADDLASVDSIRLLLETVFQLAEDQYVLI